MPQYVIEQRDASAKNTATWAHISHPFTNEKQVSTDNCIRFAFGRGSGAGTNSLHTRSQKRVRLRRHLHHRTAMPPHTRHNKPFVRSVGRPFACSLSSMRMRRRRSRARRAWTNGWLSIIAPANDDVDRGGGGNDSFSRTSPYPHTDATFAMTSVIGSEIWKGERRYCDTCTRWLLPFPVSQFGLSCHGHANKQEKEETTR